MSPVAAAVLLGVLGYVVYWWLSVTKTEKGVVNTIGLPVLDSLLDFLPNKLLESLETYRKKYGNVFLIRIVSKRIFVISEPVLGKEVLMKRPKQFRRSRGMEYAGRLMGVSLGLLHSSGAIWSKMRRATAPSFNQMNVNAKLDAIQNELQAWMERIGSQAQNKQVTLDMFPEAFSLTIRVLSRAAFGLGPEDAVGKYFFSPTFINDMKHMLQFTVQHGFLRLPTWLWKISPFYKYEVAAVEANQRLSGHCQNVIDCKRAQGNSHEGHAMIDTLIHKHGKEIQDGGLTDEEVIHNVKIFYVAGTDTTAITISWLCYFLSLNPDIQRKVREEVQSILPGSAKADMQIVKSLTYTHAVVKETMRSKNAASLLPFELEDNVDSLTLSNGMTIRTNDAVWVYIDGVLWNEDIFPRPNEFLPDRWLPEHTEPAQLSKMEEAFLAFGSGPRVCPGMSLAILESVLAIAYIVKTFTIDLACDPKDIVREMNITSNPSTMMVSLKYL